MGPAAGNLRDKYAFQRLDDCRLHLIDLISVSKLSVFTAAESPHLSIFSYRSSMEPTARHLDRIFSEQ